MRQFLRNLSNSIKGWNTCICDNSSSSSSSPAIQQSLFSREFVSPLSSPSLDVLVHSEKTLNSPVSKCTLSSSAPCGLREFLPRSSGFNRPTSVSVGYSAKDQREESRGAALPRNCANCDKVFFLQLNRRRGSVERDEYCSGECMWSYSLDVLDEQQHQHHYYQKRPARHEQQTQPRTTAHLQDGEQSHQNIEHQPFLRYVSEEESEHLLQADSDEDEDEDEPPLPLVVKSEDELSVEQYQQHHDCSSKVDHMHRATSMKGGGDDVNQEG